MAGSPTPSSYLLFPSPYQRTRGDYTPSPQNGQREIGEKGDKIKWRTQLAWIVQERAHSTHSAKHQPEAQARGDGRFLSLALRVGVTATFPLACQLFSLLDVSR